MSEISSQLKSVKFDEELIEESKRIIVILDQNEDISANTSSEEEEDEVNMFYQDITKSSYSKLNMFLISTCDLNALSSFVNNKDLRMQNPDIEKLDIFKGRIDKEMKKLVTTDLPESTSIILLNEIDRLLTFLNYHFESIPSFTSEEYKSFVYCICKFMVRNQMLEVGEHQKKLEEWINSLNTKDFNNCLLTVFNVTE